MEGGRIVIMGNELKRTGSYFKRHRGSLKLALIVFGASLALTIIGIAWTLPIDITAHGVIPTFLGIVSLYLFQDAIANKTILRFRNGVAYIVLFFLLGIIVLVANNCMCEIGTMKTRMVLLTMLVFGLMMMIRMKWPGRTS